MSDLDAIRAKLKPLMAAGIKHGDFTLASGKKSNFYFDGRLVTLSSGGARLVGEAVLALVEGKGVGAVGGMAVGADPMTGATLAVAGERGLPLDGFIVRKKKKSHGTGRQVEGPIEKGARAVLLEDVITTGGSTIRAAEALRAETGADIAGVVCLLDREEGGREALAAAGLELWPIFTRRDFPSA